MKAPTEHFSRGPRHSKGQEMPNTPLSKMKEMKKKGETGWDPHLWWGRCNRGEVSALR